MTDPDPAPTQDVPSCLNCAHVQRHQTGNINYPKGFSGYKPKFFWTFYCRHGNPETVPECSFVRGFGEACGPMGKNFEENK